MRLVFFTMLVLATTGLWAEVKPSDTDFLSDRCATCQMPVTSRSYAAQLAGGTHAIFFDDIGCLVQYLRLHPETPRVAFVRTADGSRWIGAAQASWIRSPTVRTPMGYGFHAMPDAAAVRAFLSRSSGTALTWSEVVESVPRSTGKM